MRVRIPPAPQNITEKEVQMRLGLHDPDRTPTGIDEKCAELNILSREERNRRSLEYVEELAGMRALEKARRAIMLLYLDQPQRIAAQLVLAKASMRHQDIFALKTLLEEGCASPTRLDPKIRSEALDIIERLGEITKPNKKGKPLSKRGLEQREDDVGEETA
jgi:hypothetical protein